MTSPEGFDTRVFARHCVLFCRLLRESGIAVSTGAAADLLSVARRVDVTDRAAFYYAARCLLTSDRRDWPAFDAVFHGFWRRPERPGELEVQRPSGTGLEPLPPRFPGARGGSTLHEQRPSRPGGASFGSLPGAREGKGDRPQAHPLASPGERSGGPELRTLSASDVVSALALAARVPGSLPHRWLRRTRPGSGGAVFDARGTLRRAARDHGEIADVRYLDRRTQRRRLILIGDTSRSMQPFVRAVLGLSYALQMALADVETFFFSTHLTRVTRLLRTRSPEQVLRSLQAEISDWGGGTRIGSALGSFNRQWTGRLLTTRSLVVLVTDGLDAGDADVLAREVRVLKQRSWRLVWLNPLAGGPGFEPKATGIRTMLAGVDVMLPCRDLGSLFEFLEVIGRFRGWRDLDPTLSGARRDPSPDRTVVNK